MDENLLSLLEELSLRSCGSEDENCSRDIGNNRLWGNQLHNSAYNTSSSNVSSPTYEQLTNSIPEEDLELKSAVNSLFQDLKPSNVKTTIAQSSQPQDGYDKSKLLVALLGNVDIVTCAVKKINQLVSLGKKMEQIYRCYYVDPNVHIDLNEVSQLITAFSDIYDNESYVRKVNVSRVYHAYCRKLLDIYNSRTATNGVQPDCDDRMIS